MAAQTAYVPKFCFYSRKQSPAIPRSTSFNSFMPQALCLQAGALKHSKTGHLQCQVTAGKPISSDDRPSGSPDISMLSPELQQQWCVDSNMHLGAIQVNPNGRLKAVWQCDKCPAGQPHVWTASVSSRTRGSRCPYCCNRRVCVHNSLATIAPEVAQYWNYSKNGQTPEQVSAGSHLRAEWKCPACKYEWKAPVCRRTRIRSGCPKCSVFLRKRQQSQPTFAEAQPPELAEWDHERNEEEGFYPNQITLGSSKLVHWIGSCCPRGQPHRWTAKPHNRISLGQGCGVCAGRQACVCNSLETLFPSVAAEFDVDKNGFALSEITARSQKKVWWRNAKRGSWRQRVLDRTDRRSQLYTQQAGE
ncbi:hypothetical protein ABBQ38_013423 [Trebouxia sp. C0009 RCD-2024]